MTGIALENAERRAARLAAADIRDAYAYGNMMTNPGGDGYEAVAGYLNVRLDAKRQVSASPHPFSPTVQAQGDSIA